MDNQPTDKKMTARRSRSAPTEQSSETKRKYYHSELHALLVTKLPEFVEGGRLAVPRLAQELGFSAFRLYCILKDNKLSVRALNSIVEVSKSRQRPEGETLTQEDLVSFLLN